MGQERGLWFREHVQGVNGEGDREKVVGIQGK